MHSTGGRGGSEPGAGLTKLNTGRKADAGLTFFQDSGIPAISKDLSVSLSKFNPIWADVLVFVNIMWVTSLLEHQGQACMDMEDVSLCTTRSMDMKEIPFCTTNSMTCKMYLFAS
jgi:hypothetical protein